MLKDRQKGSFFGLIIGDAMGAPYEFKKENTFNVSNKYSKGGWLKVSKGEWTDDTSMTICLAESIIEKQDIDIQDQMNKYYLWMTKGFRSSRDYCIDIGHTTEKNIKKYYNNKDIYNIKVDNKSNNYANGGMMRLAPIPICYYNKFNLIKNIIKTTIITHNSKVCIDANIIFGQLIANAIKGYPKENLFQNISFTNIEKVVKQRFVKFKNINYEPNVLPTGNVLDCIELTMYAIFKFDNFIDGLIYLLKLGNDSDTVGAIYGQLAGAIYGFKSIDKYYFDNLLYKDQLNDIFENLILINKGNYDGR